MKILESLNRMMESIEAKRSPKHESEDDVGFDAIKAKYTEVPPEVLESIITDVKEACGRKFEEDEQEQEQEVANDAEQANEEDLNKVEIEPAEGKPVNEPHKTDTLDSMNELDASEDDGTADQTPVDFYTEEDDIDDELIISDEDGEEPTEDLPPEEVVDDEIAAESDEEEDFDVYQDELDITDGDEPINETGEEPEKIDMSIPKRDDSVDAADAAMHETGEKAQKIDMSIPDDENSTDAADSAAKEIKNEDNSGAKAAMANRDNKGAFSSDVDALTEYLNEY